ncbi:Nuclear transport factor 2b, partial [Thalictrum thalictroides]
MLSFEGQKIQGAQGIVAKLTSLPFQQCQHSITTVDCQPSGPAGGEIDTILGVKETMDTFAEATWLHLNQLKTTMLAGCLSANDSQALADIM